MTPSDAKNLLTVIAKAYQAGWDDGYTAGQDDEHQAARAAEKRARAAAAAEEQQ